MKKNKNQALEPKPIVENRCEGIYSPAMNGRDSMDNELVVMRRADLRSMIHEEIKAAMREMEDEKHQKHTTKFQDRYTANELMQLWGISMPTLWSYNKKGIIHAIHDGNRIYFLKEIIDNMENPKYARKAV